LTQIISRVGASNVEF